MLIDKRPTLARAALRAIASALLVASSAVAAERTALPRIESKPGNAFTEAERQALLSWTLAQPAVKSALAGRKTRVLRVWSDTAKRGSEVYRRANVLVRDYGSGSAREINVDLSRGAIEIHEMYGVQPSAEEIEEAQAIVRRDRALARLVEDPRLTLVGGFHSRSGYPDDPCAREVCLEFAFTLPGNIGPARYVVVNLTRGVVAHHDFRAPRPGEPAPRMTEASTP